MNWIKVLQHGLKAFAFVIIASILTVIIGALTVALGFKPEGMIDPVVWKFAVYPGIIALIAALDNLRKHLPEQK